MSLIERQIARGNEQPVMQGMTAGVQNGVHRALKYPLKYLGAFIANNRKPKLGVLVQVPIGADDELIDLGREHA